MDENQPAVEQEFDDVAEAELESGGEETPPQPVTAVRMRDLLIALPLIWVFEGLFAGILFVATGAYAEGFDGMAQRPGLMVSMVLVPWAFCLWVSWLIGHRRHQLSFRQLFQLHPVPRATMVASICAGFGLSIFAMLLGSLLVPESESQPIMELLVYTSPDNPEDTRIRYYFLLLIVLLPIAEELYYRGFLFSAFERWIGTGAGVMVMCLWFALMHGPQLSFEVGALAVILIAGLVFTWHRIRHRSVWPAIGCHVTYNATLMAAFLLSWHAAEL